MSIDQLVSEFKEYVKKIKHYNEALGVLYWDLRTGAPRKGVEQRSEVIGTLSAESFNMNVSDQMKRYIDNLSEPEHYEKLDAITKGILREVKKEYDKLRKIPANRYQEYVILTSKAESVWEEAKKNSDFSMFQPYLEKIVDFQKEFVEYWGYEGHPYNTLLDQYEPGLTVEKLDQLFAGLREKLVPLVKKVQNSSHRPNVDFIRQYFDPAKQKEFSKFILQKMGYDFNAGRLDESAHPFAIGLNPGDVRVTTRYNAYDFREGIFGTIHEGGHALYEQNISPELIGTPLCDGTSMGIHESQSRYWENMVGRSLPFWECYYDDLVKVFPDELRNVSVEQFYLACNESMPSLIRTEADELTYNLHIMLRYEIEKGLLNGDIQVSELPALWNEKMEEYLGVVPENDAEGVLQDVHWSGGGFGYFPSYSLGNLYAAQFEHSIRKDLHDYDAIIRRGELNKIKEWLTDKVHKHGKLLTPNEILKNATGEELNAKYLTDYLEKKYSTIYRLEK